MHNIGILRDIVVILLVSMPVLLLFKRLKLPAITGFLFTGVIIGPYGLGLVEGTEEIKIMAEIGVILLMFTIGIEFSISKLIKMRQELFFSGGLQVLLTISISGLIFFLVGQTITHSIFLGMIISLSSTVIVLTLLVAKNELSTPHGRISVGIAIFQDLAIVPMLILLPILASKEAFDPAGVAVRTVLSFGAVGVILLLSKLLMPRFLLMIARLRSREAFTMGVLLIALGVGYFTGLIGLSFSIGAFIAGVIISESEYSHEITAEILPFKDVFNSLFFVSVGLLLNVNFLIEYGPLVTLVVIGIVLVKSWIIIVIVMLMKYPLRIGILAGVTLAQVGEFSFVLIQEGMDLNLISEFYFNIFLAATIFTLILTPFMIKLAHYSTHKISSGIDKIKDKKGEEAHPEFNLNGHIVIVGFGLNGKNLARTLKEAGIQYVVVEINPDTVARYSAEGENILYGDITRKEINYAVNMSKARVAVLAISDPSSTQIAIKVIKSINSKVHIIARTRYISEIEPLLKLGADEVIPEEFETSLQIFSKVMRQYHVPINIIMRQVALLRGESYSMMRKEPEAAPQLIHLDELLQRGLTEVYYIDARNSCAGKSIKEIDLRAKTQATIISIIRNSAVISTPSGSEKLLPGDSIVITGTHQAVDDAIGFLESGMPDSAGKDT